MYTSNGLKFGKVEEDHAICFKFLKDESWKMTHQKTIINKTDQKNWYHNLDSDPNCPRNLVLSVQLFSAKWEHGSSGLLIGCYKVLRVDYVNRSADVGWDLLKEHRGKGFGKALVTGGANFCFDILNLRRLNAEILTINEASQKCALAAGFVYEGVQREAIHKPEGYVDSQFWGLLVSERIS